MIAGALNRCLSFWGVGTVTFSLCSMSKRGVHLLGSLDGSRVDAPSVIGGSSATHGGSGPKAGIFVLEIA